jgi:predicted sulfurtransferase
MAVSDRRTFTALLLGLAAAPRTLRAQAPLAKPNSPAEVPRIEGAELKKLVDEGKAVLLDVRGQQAWDDGHAQGAIHIPLDQVSNRAKELPKDKLIGAYCT